MSPCAPSPAHQIRVQQGLPLFPVGIGYVLGDKEADWHSVMGTTGKNGEGGI